MDHVPQIKKSCGPNFPQSLANDDPVERFRQADEEDAGVAKLCLIIGSTPRSASDGPLGTDVHCGPEPPLLQVEYPHQALRGHIGQLQDDEARDGVRRDDPKDLPVCQLSNESLYRSPSPVSATACTELYCHCAYFPQPRPGFGGS